MYRVSKIFPSGFGLSSPAAGNVASNMSQLSTCSENCCCLKTQLCLVSYLSWEQSAPDDSLILGYKTPAPNLFILLWKPTQRLLDNFKHGFWSTMNLFPWAGTALCFYLITTSPRLSLYTDCNYFRNLMGPYLLLIPARFSHMLFCLSTIVFSLFAPPLNTKEPLFVKFFLNTEYAYNC